LGRYKTKRPQPTHSKNNLPIWLIIGGIGLILILSAVFLSGIGREKADIQVTGTPKIQVEQEVYDYGVVKLGGVPIRTVVKVTNVGDQTLRFSEPPYIEVLEGC
jgi:hypothetical protein